MLALTRRTGEILLFEIPGLAPIVVKVVTSRRGSVRLGIEAPELVKIRREEMVRKDEAQHGRFKHTDAQQQSE